MPDKSQVPNPAAESGKWKSRVLSSSITLEYEIAKALARDGFHVSPDFPYHRLDGGIEKECSVDVRGIRALDGPDRLASCLLDVLVECKYRHPGVTWLFLPQPNRSTGSLYSPLQGVEHFSPWFIRDTLWPEGASLAVCYKGIEIGFGDDKERALDAQIRHGLAQLQFALPALLALRIRAYAFRDINDVKPFFFVPLLVTTATLVVAEATFNTQSVQDAEDVASLGTVVPALIATVETGPNFDAHCKYQFSDLLTLTKTRSMKSIEEFRRGAKQPESELPAWLITRIAENGADAVALADFTNVLICNITAFEAQMSIIQRAFVKQAKSISKKPLIEW